MRANLERWKARLREGAEAGLAAEIEIVVADGSLGFPSRAPFDRILLSAGVRGGVRADPPGKRGFSERPLLDQLADGGILLYPETLGELRRIRKRGAALERAAWAGVAFVPLRGRNA
jgi:protein-L-isoaspartate O-methyltransferase